MTKTYEKIREKIVGYDYASMWKNHMQGLMEWLIEKKMSGLTPALIEGLTTEEYLLELEN